MGNSTGSSTSILSERWDKLFGNTIDGNVKSMELEGVARLLLKNAANVNAQGEIHGSALQVASTFFLEAVY